MEPGSGNKAGGSARVAVVDMGTNSTRLLVADVNETDVREIERRSTVTRLGRGVDTAGCLAAEAIEEVCATVADYIEIYRPLKPEHVIAIATSAVRDASNSSAFIAELRERFALGAAVLAGADEARLTYSGATHGRTERDPTLVIDIGGGSTELIVGAAGSDAPDFHVSLQAGVVRQTERHLHEDPPPPRELQRLADDVRATIDAGVPPEVRASARAAVGVAGTATSLAAIDQELEPYDPRRVHGYVLELGEAELLLARLAQMPLAQRREVRGLHPDRAPTIVAGAAILLEVLRAFRLDRAEVSEHDLLHGVALAHAQARTVTD